MVRRPVEGDRHAMQLIFDVRPGNSCKMATESYYCRFEFLNDIRIPVKLSSQWVVTVYEEHM